MGGGDNYPEIFGTPRADGKLELLIVSGKGTPLYDVTFSIMKALTFNIIVVRNWGTLLSGATDTGIALEQGIYQINFNAKNGPFIEMPTIPALQRQAYAIFEHYEASRGPGHDAIARLRRLCEPSGGANIWWFFIAAGARHARKAWPDAADALLVSDSLRRLSHTCAQPNPRRPEQLASRLKGSGGRRSSTSDRYVLLRRYEMNCAAALAATQPKGPISERRVRSE